MFRTQSQSITRLTTRCDRALAVASLLSERMLLANSIAKSQAPGFRAWNFPQVFSRFAAWIEVTGRDCKRIKRQLHSCLACTPNFWLGRN